MQLLCNEDCKETQQIKGKGWAMILGLLMLIMPKCAFCWAAYMSFFASLGLVVKYQSWYLPLITILFLVTLVKICYTCIRQKNFVSLLLAVTAAVIIMARKDASGKRPMEILCNVDDVGGSNDEKPAAPVSLGLENS